MIDSAQARMVELVEERNGLVDQVAAMARQVAALKRELSKQHQDSPKMVEAQEVFDFWIDKLGKTKRTTFGPKRQKAVLARLNEKPLTDSEVRKDDLLRAVEGLAAKRYVGPKGRTADPAGAKLNDELEIAMRDETNVERFMGYAAEGTVSPIRPQVPPELQSWLVRCDCGHTRMEHSYPLQPLWVPESMVGWEPCRECECCDFETVMQDHRRAAA